MPQSAAGMRVEPPVSVPSPAGTMRAAMAAAVPPDEPPGILVRSYGMISNQGTPVPVLDLDHAEDTTYDRKRTPLATHDKQKGHALVKRWTHTVLPIHLKSRV